MLLETLSDFFLFLSSDKATITSKNLSDFDIFISKKQNVYENTHPTGKANISTIKTSASSPSSLSNGLFSLLNEILYYLYTTKKIKLDNNTETQITNKVNAQMKAKNPAESNGWGYQEQAKKNVMMKKIKEKETKNTLITMLRRNELKFDMVPAEYIEFFNIVSPKYKNIVTKFITRIKSSGDGTVSNDDKSHSDLDKSNPNNKSGLSYVSEKDGLVQDKEKFLDVLSKVKINLDNDKEQCIKIDDVHVKIENDTKSVDHIHEKNLDKSQHKNEDKNKSFNKLDSKSETLRKGTKENVDLHIQENQKDNNNQKKQKRRKRDKTDGNCCFIF